MTLVAVEADLRRMRRQRAAKVALAFAGEDAEALVLLGQANVAYATGAPVLQADAARGALERVAAVLVAGDSRPHVFSPWPGDLAGEFPADHLHGALYPEAPSGAEETVDVLRRLAGAAPGRILVDEMPSALYDALRRRLAGTTVDDGSRLLARARLYKSDDEIACIERAQRINEAAMDHVRPLLRPGAVAAELASAFLGRSMELGAEACVVEPIFQPVPRRSTEGLRTWAGETAFPLPATDRRYQRGDVIWIDSGVSYGGYHSDFGRTWIVGEGPSPAQQAVFGRWRRVLDALSEEIGPGASAGHLTEVARAAAGGKRPWLAHLYLGHGIGMSSAETPLVGTDLGPLYDDRLVLEAGMVLVLEPVVFEEGPGGYRAEEIFAVTEEGCRQLTSYSYEPFS